MSRPSYLRPHPLLAAALLLGLAAPAAAMTEIGEGELAELTGEGIAIVLENVSLKAGPTSYIELTGTNQPAGPQLQFLRGDLRWYGLSYTSASAATGQAWSGSCSNVGTPLGLGCPMGGTIAQLAPHDNPLVLRVFDYVGTTVDGAINQTRSVLELLFPSRHEPYRFAFWGEINVGTGTTRRGTTPGTTGGSTIGDGTNKLQVQNIWSNINQGGSVLRLFQTSEANSSLRTLGIQYINNFAANVRMSVAQTLFSPDTLGQTPEFDSREGLYIGDYRISLTAGQLHYQALVFDDAPEQNGNFQIKLTPIPNIPNVYNTFYGRTSAQDPTGGYDRTLIGPSNSAYQLSHGFVRMGDFAPTHRANNSTDYPYAPPGFNAVNAPITNMISELNACMADRPACSAGGPSGRNTPYNTTDGVFFVASPGQTFQVFTRSPNYMFDGDVDPDLNANNPAIATIPVGGGGSSRVNLTTINLGDTNINGMMLHSLSIKTLGAQ